MGQFPLQDPESRNRIKGWRNQPGMMGLRWALLQPAEQKWLNDGLLDWVWPAAEKEGHSRRHDGRHLPRQVPRDRRSASPTSR